MTNTAHTVLNDSILIADVAHYYHCCTTAPGRAFCRDQQITRDALEAWACGASADTEELAALLRSARYQSKRFTKAVGRHAKGLITEEQYNRAHRASDIALARLGRHIVDSFYRGYETLVCPIHPHAHVSLCG